MVKSSENCLSEQRPREPTRARSPSTRRVDARSTAPATPAASSAPSCPAACSSSVWRVAHARFMVTKLLSGPRMTSGSEACLTICSTPPTAFMYASQCPESPVPGVGGGRAHNAGHATSLISSRSSLVIPFQASTPRGTSVAWSSSEKKSALQRSTARAARPPTSAAPLAAPKAVPKAAAQLSRSSRKAAADDPGAGGEERGRRRSATPPPAPGPALRAERVLETQPSAVRSACSAAAAVGAQGEPCSLKVLRTALTAETLQRTSLSSSGAPGRPCMQLWSRDIFAAARGVADPPRLTWPALPSADTLATAEQASSGRSRARDTSSRAASKEAWRSAI
mmetsp:Transcript_61415/g.194397  ORF Transcript_61415/g.194397 Transcript_61415/m.194397 type:complete len:338 (-) Transcript_61415:50-1063(-)